MFIAPSLKYLLQYTMVGKTSYLNRYPEARAEYFVSPSSGTLRTACNVTIRGKISYLD